MTTSRKSWFDIGYAEGRANKEERVPEQYGARQSYRRGWAQGKLDYNAAQKGQKELGPRDPFMVTA